MNKLAEASLEVQRAAEEVSLQRDLLLEQLTQTVTTMGEIQSNLMQVVSDLAQTMGRIERDIHIHDQQLARMPDTVGQDG